MKEVLIDTSVWIDFLNGTVNSQSDAMTRAIEQDAEIFICRPVIQEVLQGISDDQEHYNLKEKLFSLNILIIDPLDAALGASELYRTLRKKGISIRKTNDTLIAFYCIYYNIPILHKDRDFNAISKHSKLKIFR